MITAAVAATASVTATASVARPIAALVDELAVVFAASQQRQGWRIRHGQEVPTLSAMISSRPRSMLSEAIARTEVWNAVDGYVHGSGLGG